MKNKYNKNEEMHTKNEKLNRQKEKTEKIYENEIDDNENVLLFLLGMMRNRFGQDRSTQLKNRFENKIKLF